MHPVNDCSGFYVPVVSLASQNNHSAIQGLLFCSEIFKESDL